jgi:hypothetical protein
MEETRNVYIGFWMESLKERDQWQGLNVGGRIILKWVLVGTGYGPVEERSSENGNESSDSVKCRGPLKNGSAPGG